MGAFIVNFHARTDDPAPVRKMLAADAERAWLGPPVNGWVSFYEERADTQDSARIEDLCERVSRATGGPVIAFLVHDSDFLCYWLFDAGTKRDEYNSCPDHFGDLSELLEPGESAEELLARIRGDADALLPLCPAGTDRSSVEALLRVGPGDYVFAEEHLDKLARRLGIDPQRAAMTYRDVGLELSPEESNLEFAGRGTPPEPEEDSWNRLDPTAVSPGAVQIGPFVAAAGGTPNLAGLLATAQTPNQKLLLAIAVKDASAAEEAISAGADVNTSQGAPLMMAIGAGSEDLVRLLLNRGADPAKSPHALMAAVSTGKEAFAGLLLDHGANASQGTAFGWWLLHVAVQHGNPAIVKRLLDAGADPDVRNPQGQTAAEHAEAMIKQTEAAAKVAARLGQPFDLGNQLLPGLRAVRDLLSKASGGTGGTD